MAGQVSGAGSRLRAVTSGCVGNLVEWYDFYTYAAFSLYFAPAFFPGSDPVVQQLNAAVLFAFGFIARPLGGWLFGHYADRHGRRNAMMLSVLLMCGGSLAIAVLPTYAALGPLAPTLLGLARVAQGLSLGGEYGASATYLSEIATPRHRGFYASFQHVTLIGGQLCALAVLIVLEQWLLTPEQLRDWGWRIPFALGAVLALVALVMRKHMEETPQFLASQMAARQTSALRDLLQHPRELLLVVGLTMGGTAAFYTYTTYMQKFLRLSVGLDAATTTLVTAGALLFALLLQPLYGALSDHIGRRPLLIWFGLMGTLCTVPLLDALQSAKTAGAAFLLLAAAWLIVSGYTAINAVVKAELFPARVRATGVGLPYALTVSIFGGTAEPIALWFKASGNERGFYFYLTGMIAVSLLVYLGMRDTRRHGTLENS